ncbi:MAG: response regulator transcription factor [Clostridia bacterium]|nr:response regulator transcription factor [Clostridia bacterium]MBR3554207.1 response regulator transcription factor [Clostridia bacterium]
MKVLLAEDENDLREVVAAYLELQGYYVVSVANGAEAVKELDRDAYDAVVMDIMMPVMDGVTAMRKIRASGHTTPAIFLTAKSEVADRVEGLDAGADDYLTKPFAMEELSARLRALYRRKRDYKTRLFSFGNLELDTEASELRAHNTIALALKEARLLSCLLSTAGQEWPADTLLSEVWPGEDVSSDLVQMYISFLNAKLASVRANAVIEKSAANGYRILEVSDV